MLRSIYEYNIQGASGFLTWLLKQANVTFLMLTLFVWGRASVQPVDII